MTFYMTKCVVGGGVLEIKIKIAKIDENYRKV